MLVEGGNFTYPTSTDGGESAVWENAAPADSPFSAFSEELGGAPEEVLPPSEELRRHDGEMATENPPQRKAEDEEGAAGSSTTAADSPDTPSSTLYSRIPREEQTRQGRRRLEQCRVGPVRGQYLKG